MNNQFEEKEEGKHVKEEKEEEKYQFKNYYYLIFFATCLPVAYIWSLPFLSVNFPELVNIGDAAHMGHKTVSSYIAK